MAGYCARADRGCEEEDEEQGDGGEKEKNKKEKGKFGNKEK